MVLKLCKLVWSAGVWQERIGKVGNTVAFLSTKGTKGELAVTRLGTETGSSVEVAERKHRYREKNIIFLFLIY